MHSFTVTPIISERTLFKECMQNIPVSLGYLNMSNNHFNILRNLLGKSQVKKKSPSVFLKI